MHAYTPFRAVQALHEVSLTDRRQNLLSDDSMSTLFAANRSLSVIQTPCDGSVFCRVFVHCHWWAHGETEGEAGGRLGAVHHVFILTLCISAIFYQLWYLCRLSVFSWLCWLCPLLRVKGPAGAHADLRAVRQSRFGLRLQEVQEVLFDCVRQTVSLRGLMSLSNLFCAGS